MGKQRGVIDNGSWALAEELYQAGDPRFVAEVRLITDADRLGDFAAVWFGDQRPAARRLLLDYLAQPLNAFRHEPLVKRLFKLAEKAGDAEVMGRFVVLFDRSIRRKRASGWRSVRESFTTHAAATERLKQLQQTGLHASRYQSWDPVARSERFWVQYGWQGEYLLDASDDPTWRPYYNWSGRNRGKSAERAPAGPYPLIDKFRKTVERSQLFSVATRKYLRRRAWRFFRNLGKTQPEKYVPAVTALLKCYEDRDVADGLALLDRWGLVHILFHHSPVLNPRPRGWALAEGRGLSQLAPAPMYEPLWQAAPQALLELLTEAKCRAVRQWATFLLRRDHAAFVQALPTDVLFRLLTSPDPVVAALGADLLQAVPDLTALGVGRLLAALRAAEPECVPVLCKLFETRLPAEQVAFEEAVQLAVSRPLPIARLGFRWLQAKTPRDAEDCKALLGLAEVQAEPLRPEIVSWARGVLAPSPFFEPDWLLAWFDSRHADVRAEGWAWLHAEPRARDDVGLWQKLLESPYDDVRLVIVAELENWAARRPDAAPLGELDPELVRFLWATVLLNIHRGGRKKPVIVRQLVDRLLRRPAGAAALLPILAVALRSLRGPEWRAGLTGVVQLAERNRDLLPLLHQTFPELRMTV